MEEKTHNLLNDITHIKETSLSFKHTFENGQLATWKMFITSKFSLDSSLGLSSWYSFFKPVLSYLKKRAVASEEPLLAGGFFW